MFQLPPLIVFRACCTSHSFLLFFSPIKVFPSLNDLPFPIKPKIAITLPSLLVKEQKEIIVCLFLREFSLTFSSENGILKELESEQSSRRVELGVGEAWRGN